MKRILAVIIAITLVAAMLPTFAFAAETEADGGIRIKYDVFGAVKTLGATWENSATSKANRIPFTEVDYDLTGGLFSFAGSTNGDWSNHSSINWAAAYGIQLAGGQHIAYEVYVPKAGTYTMEMWCGNSAQTNSITTVYMSRGTKTTAGGSKIGSYNNYEEGTYAGSKPPEGMTAQLSKVVDEARYIEGIEIPEPGKYIFTFHSGISYCSMGTFYLIENGTGTATSIAALTGSIDKKNLSLDGRTNAQMTVTGLTMSDGTAGDLSGYTVTFKSSDSSVATVDATGKITAVGEGSADIIACTTDSYGAEAAYIETVNVLTKGAVLDYNFARAQAATPLKEWAAATYNAASEAERLAILEKADFTRMTYDVTKGFIKFVDTNIDKDYALADGTHNFRDVYWPGCGIRLYGDAYQMCGGKYLAFEIDVPVAGEYDTTMFLRSGSTNKAYNVTARLFVSPDSESVFWKTSEVGAFNVYTAPSEVMELGSVKFPTAGKYCVGIKVDGSSTGSHTMFRAVSFVNGTSDAIVNGKITSTASEINVDEKETATVSASGYLSGTAIDETIEFAKIEEYDPKAATFTYSSSDTSVATVDAKSGLITPKKEGKVTITATADGSVVNALTTDITVTENKPGEEVADTKVNVYISALEGGKVETNLESEVAEVEIGTKVLAEAGADEGYTFAYWADSTGKVISENAKEIFTINVNTSAIAVFEKIASESDTNVSVYFYNGNGEKLATETVAKGTAFADVKKPTATLTGFEFDKWSIADSAVISTITRAVALFKDTDNTYTVKADGAVVASGKKYGEEVTVKATEDSFTCWKLGGKIVSYDKEFTFDVYADTELTKVCEGTAEAIPTVILDTVDGDHFLTYNVPAGFTKLEAGILFAESGNPTIGSFYAKATEKTGSGQFTAKPNKDESVARGYIIFRDASGSVRVIYAD